MSTTKLDLIGRTADVVRLIKWYCSRTHVRKIECMRRCGFNSMISDVWVRMLEQFEKKDTTANGSAAKLTNWVGAE